MGLWTLTAGAVEQSLTQWGFADCKLRFVSQAESTFTASLRGVANLVAAPPIAFEAAVILRRNRVFGGGVWSGGSVVFQGRQVTRRGSANSRSPSDTLVFADAWYDLSNLVFQQKWQYSSPIATTYFSRLNLFQRYSIATAITAAANGSGIINITLGAALFLQNGDYVTIVGLPGVSAPQQVTVTDATHFSIPGQLSSAYGGSGAVVWPNNQLITNGDQMIEIINYANSCGVAIQAGTIDLNWKLPIYPVRGVMCSSALQICMRPTPDAISWIDYTTTPPTFNCRQRANLTAITYPYKSGNHSSSEITPRYDLQAPQVVLQYEKNSNINGGIFESFNNDVYPPGSTGQAVRSVVCPIDLRGAQSTNISVQVTASALNLTDLNWWKDKKNELKAMSGAVSLVQGLAMVSGTLSVIREDTKADITGTWASTFPNEYVKGEISPWMGVQAVWVTVSAFFTYDEYDPSNRRNRSITSANPHQISVRVKLTNSPVGVATYTANQFFDPGETAPAGLAQFIYNSLQQLQYEGEHRVVDPSFSSAGTLIRPQNVLNLSGGAAAWATMAATIQSVEYDVFRNVAEIAIGPARHIAPGDLEELLQFYRYRVVNDNPALRISGQETGTSGSVGGDTQVENTTHANPVAALHTVAAGAAATTTRIQSDAINQLIKVQVQDATGTAVSGKSSIVAALADLQPDSTARAAAFRWLYFKDAKNSCAAMKMLVLGTAPEPDT